MICLDTNLLICAHRSGTPEHGAAQRAIERAAMRRQGWGFALPSVGEFWAQVTHPRFPGGPSTPKQAAGFIMSLSEEGGARVFVPKPDFAALLLETVTEMAVFEREEIVMSRDGNASLRFTK